jgi:hypothetical protein
MRLAVSTLLTLLLVATVQAAGEGKPGKPDPHVRPLQEEGKRLFAVGLNSSATFQRLVRRLEHSDVIVYVDLTVDVPPQLVGALRFLTMTKSSRFLVVRLNRTLAPGAALVGILGHELQHAVEVADAEDVTSAEGLDRLYRRIGVATGPEMYDTEAARQTGNDVRDEVSHRSREVRLASQNSRNRELENSRRDCPRLDSGGSKELPAVGGIVEPSATAVGCSQDR